MRPHPHDVLCGRGSSSISSHPGNSRFKSLIDDQMKRYMRADNQEKARIRRDVVGSVRSLDPPGRFLQRCSRTMLWHDVGDKKADDRVNHALREGAAAVVLFCQGKKRYTHPGNKLLRKMFQQEVSLLEKEGGGGVASGMDMDGVAERCIRAWRSQVLEGRFLRLDEGTGEWEDVDDDEAQDDIRRLLSEFAEGGDGRGGTGSKRKHGEMATVV